MVVPLGICLEVNLNSSKLFSAPQHQLETCQVCQWSLNCGKAWTEYLLASPALIDSCMPILRSVWISEVHVRNEE
jgi:hypothetical protein